MRWRPGSVCNIECRVGERLDDIRCPERDTPDKSHEAKLEGKSPKQVRKGIIAEYASSKAQHKINHEEAHQGPSSDLAQPGPDAVDPVLHRVYGAIQHLTGLSAGCVLLGETGLRPDQDQCGGTGEQGEKRALSHVTVLSRISR